MQASSMSNRECFQQHGLLSRERIEQLLDIEDAARNLLQVREDTAEVFQDDVDTLSDALDVEHCE